MTAPILIRVLLQPNIYPNVVVKQQINYRNTCLQLTDEERKDLEKSLPAFWHTEKDKLVQFTMFEDNTYLCERYKEYFDYNTRSTDHKYYLFDSGKEAEAKQLYVSLLEAFSKIKIKRIEDLYTAVTESIGDISYVKYSLLEARDTLLKDSDYTVLPDYPIAEEERQQWVEYRQKLRDVTTQQAWIDNDLMNIEMPVSPNPKKQLYVYGEQIATATSILAPDLMDLSIEQAEAQGLVEECLQNIASVTVKYEILRGLSSLRIPLFDIGYKNIEDPTNYFNATLSELESMGEEYEKLVTENIIPENWWTAATSNLNKTIDNLNTKLGEYDISFTINDILHAILEKNMKSNQLIIDETPEG